MIDRWYYTHEGQTLGPVTVEQLRQLAGGGRLLPDDLIWPEGRQQSEAVPAQASIDFPKSAGRIENKTAWLEDLRAAAEAERRSAHPSKPSWLDDLRASIKAENKPASPAKSNWLDDIRAVEEKERAKDRKQRSRSAAGQGDNRERPLNAEQVRPARAGPMFRKFVQRRKAAAIVAVLVSLAILAGIPLLAWNAVQRERDRSAAEEKTRLQAEVLEGYVRKATLATQRGAWREALAGYDQALKAGHLDPAGLRLSKARVFLALDDGDGYRRELDALASLSNLGGHEGSVLLLRAESLLGRDDIQAEQLLHQALEKKNLPPGEDAYARALLADTTLTAVDLLRQAQALAPYQVHARASLELLLILLARLDEARDELRVHALMFPDDPEAKVLQALLLAVESKPAEARKVLDGLRGKLPGDELAALNDLATFLAELRNPAHPSDPVLGLPDLSRHWQTAQPALRRLWPALAGFAPGNAHSLFSRLPPRLRKSLEAVPEMLMMIARGQENTKKVPTKFVERFTHIVNAHPEGTLMYVQALAQWRADQWRQADQTALHAVQTPALVSICRPAFFIAAASKAMQHTSFRKDSVQPLRAVEALFVSFHPAFFAAPLAEATSDQLLLFPAVGNLRQMLALGPYRPLIPDLAVRLAIASREYNLARQLLDDWKREAEPDAQQTILGLRAETELEAGVYGPALEAAGEYLRRKPDDATMLQVREKAKRKLVEQARPYLPAAPGKRAP